MHESVTSEKVIKFWYATFYEKPEIAKNSISKVLEEVFDATNQENPLAKLLSYGIYKYLMANQLGFSQENIEKGYNYAIVIINKNVDDEKRDREKKGETYSHSSYFKSSQCRIDYNKAANISETYDLIDKLLIKTI